MVHGVPLMVHWRRWVWGKLQFGHVWRWPRQTGAQASIWYKVQAGKRNLGCLSDIVPEGANADVKLRMFGDNSQVVGS